MDPHNMISDFWAFVDNIEDQSGRVTIYISMEELLKRMSGKKMDISDDQPHAIELCL